MNARDRLVSNTRIVWLALVITVNSYPMHFAATAYLILADDRHIIFDLATEQARRTAKTCVKIDDHPPFVFSVFVTGPVGHLAVIAGMTIVRLFIVKGGERQFPN